MEDRLLLSASYTCGANYITIVGDSAAASTIVIDDAAGSFTVTGATKVGTGTLPLITNADNVTIKYVTKNQADTLTYNATTTSTHALKAFVFNGGTAVDTVSITDGAIKNVTIKAGNGANSVTINGAAVDIIGKLNITAGKNADTITLGGTTGTQILGAINLNLGAAGTSPLQNDVEIGAGTYGAIATSTTPATKFNIVGGNDIDLVHFAGATTVNGIFAAQLKGGNDSVLMNTAAGTGLSAFSNAVTLDTGKGDDTVSIATSTNTATATFAKQLSILLGDGNDILTLSGGKAANDITVTGNLNVDFGKSAATVGDRLVIGTSYLATVVTLNGADNVINFGTAGLKTTTNINASSIVLGTGSSTSIGVKKSSKADISDALNNGIASAVQGFTGVIDGLYIGII